MEQYHIIIIIAIIFFIIEIFTSGFLAASIGIGFLFAALGNYLDTSTEWQVYLFTIGIFLSFIGIRPLLKKLDVDESTNSDRLIGMEALVVEKIGEKFLGRIKIDGDVWQAKSINGEEIEKGTMVKIVNYQSIILIVKLLK